MRTIRLGAVARRVGVGALALWLCTQVLTLHSRQALSPAARRRAVRGGVYAPSGSDATSGAPSVGLVERGRAGESSSEQLGTRTARLGASGVDDGLAAGETSFTPFSPFDPQAWRWAAQSAERESVKADVGSLTAAVPHSGVSGTAASWTFEAWVQLDGAPSAPWAVQQDGCVVSDSRGRFALRVATGAAAVEGSFAFELALAESEPAGSGWAQMLLGLGGLGGQLNSALGFGWAQRPHRDASPGDSSSGRGGGDGLPADGSGGSGGEGSEGAHGRAEQGVHSACVQPGVERGSGLRLRFGARPVGGGWAHVAIVAAVRASSGEHGGEGGEGPAADPNADDGGAGGADGGSGCAFAAYLNGEAVALRPLLPQPQARRGGGGAAGAEDADGGGGSGSARGGGGGGAERVRPLAFAADAAVCRAMRSRAPGRGAHGGRAWGQGPSQQATGAGPDERGGAEGRADGGGEGGVGSRAGGAAAELTLCALCSAASAQAAAAESGAPPSAASAATPLVARARAWARPLRAAEVRAAMLSDWHAARAPAAEQQGGWRAAGGGEGGVAVRALSASVWVFASATHHRPLAAAAGGSGAEGTPRRGSVRVLLRVPEASAAPSAAAADGRGGAGCSRAATPGHGGARGGAGECKPRICAGEEAEEAEEEEGENEEEKEEDVDDMGAGWAAEADAGARAALRSAAGRRSGGGRIFGAADGAGAGEEEEDEAWPYDLRPPIDRLPAAPARARRAHSACDGAALCLLLGVRSRRVCAIASLHDARLVGGAAAAAAAEAGAAGAASARAWVCTSARVRLNAPTHVAAVFSGQGERGRLALFLDGALAAAAGGGGLLDGSALLLPSRPTAGGGAPPLAAGARPAPWPAAEPASAEGGGGGGAEVGACGWGLGRPWRWPVRLPPARALGGGGGEEEAEAEEAEADEAGAEAAAAPAVALLRLRLHCAGALVAPGEAWGVSDVRALFGAGGGEAGGPFERRVVDGGEAGGPFERRGVDGGGAGGGAPCAPACPEGVMAVLAPFASAASPDAAASGPAPSSSALPAAQIDQSAPAAMAPLAPAFAASAVHLGMSPFRAWLAAAAERARLAADAEAVAAALGAAPAVAASAGGLRANGEGSDSGSGSGSGSGSDGDGDGGACGALAPPNASAAVISRLGARLGVWAVVVATRATRHAAARTLALLGSPPARSQGGAWGLGGLSGLCNLTGVTVVEAEAAAAPDVAAGSALGDALRRRGAVVRVERAASGRGRAHTGDLASAGDGGGRGEGEGRPTPSGARSGLRTSLLNGALGAIASAGHGWALLVDAGVELPAGFGGALQRFLLSRAADATGIAALRVTDAEGQRWHGAVRFARAAAGGGGLWTPVEAAAGEAWGVAEPTPRFHGQASFGALDAPFASPAAHVRAGGARAAAAGARALRNVSAVGLHAALLWAPLVAGCGGLAADLDATAADARADAAVSRAIAAAEAALAAGGAGAAGAAGGEERRRARAARRAAAVEAALATGAPGAAQAVAGLGVVGGIGAERSLPWGPTAALVDADLCLRLRARACLRAALAAADAPLAQLAEARASVVLVGGTVAIRAAAAPSARAYAAGEAASALLAAKAAAAAGGVGADGGMFGDGGGGGGGEGRDAVSEADARARFDRRWGATLAAALASDEKAARLAGMRAPPRAASGGGSGRGGGSALEVRWHVPLRAAAGGAAGADGAAGGGFGAAGGGLSSGLRGGVPVGGGGDGGDAGGGGAPGAGAEAAAAIAAELEAGWWPQPRAGAGPAAGLSFVLRPPDGFGLGSSRQGTFLVGSHHGAHGGGALGGPDAPRAGGFGAGALRRVSPVPLSSALALFRAAATSLAADFAGSHPTVARLGGGGGGGGGGEGAPGTLELFDAPSGAWLGASVSRCANAVVVGWYGASAWAPAADADLRLPADGSVSLSQPASGEAIALRRATLSHALSLDKAWAADRRTLHRLSRAGISRARAAYVGTPLGARLATAAAAGDALASVQLPTAAGACGSGAWCGGGSAGAGGHGAPAAPLPRVTLSVVMPHRNALALAPLLRALAWLQAEEAAGSAGAASAPDGGAAAAGSARLPPVALLVLTEVGADAERTRWLLGEMGARAAADVAAATVAPAAAAAVAAGGGARARRGERELLGPPAGVFVADGALVALEELLAHGASARADGTARLSSAQAAAGAAAGAGLRLHLLPHCEPTLLSAAEADGALAALAHGVRLLAPNCSALELLLGPALGGAGGAGANGTAALSASNRPVALAARPADDAPPAQRDAALDEWRAAALDGRAILAALRDAQREAARGGGSGGGGGGGGGASRWWEAAADGGADGGAAKPAHAAAAAAAQLADARARARDGWLRQRSAAAVGAALLRQAERDAADVSNASRWWPPRGAGARDEWAALLPAPGLNALQGCYAAASGERCPSPAATPTAQPPAPARTLRLLVVAPAALPPLARAAPRTHALGEYARELAGALAAHGGAGVRVEMVAVLSSASSGELAGGGPGGPGGGAPAWSWAIDGVADADGRGGRRRAGAGADSAEPAAAVVRTLRAGVAGEYIAIADYASRSADAVLLVLGRGVHGGLGGAFAACFLRRLRVPCLALAHGAPPRPHEHAALAALRTAASLCFALVVPTAADARMLGAALGRTAGPAGGLPRIAAVPYGGAQLGPAAAAAAGEGDGRDEAAEQRRAEAEAARSQGAAAAEVGCAGAAALAGGGAAAASGRSAAMAALRLSASSVGGSCVLLVDLRASSVGEVVAMLRSGAAAELAAARVALVIAAPSRRAPGASGRAAPLVCLPPSAASGRVAAAVAAARCARAVTAGVGVSAAGARALAAAADAAAFAGVAVRIAAAELPPPSGQGGGGGQGGSSAGGLQWADLLRAADVLLAPLGEGARAALRADGGWGIGDGPPLVRDRPGARHLGLDAGAGWAGAAVRGGAAAREPAPEAAAVGGALAEAMLAGLPIVATPHAGAAALLRGGCGGVLAGGGGTGGGDGGAEAAITAALELLAGPASARRGLALCGRERARREVAWPRVAGAFAALLGLPSGAAGGGAPPAADTRQGQGLRAAAEPAGQQQ